MNKQQLAQKIWASANQMRSKIEANEYKDYILGFIFYKYLSDKEIKFLKENDYDDELLKTVSEEDDETVKWVQENIGYFIAYKDLFSTWLSMGKDFDVSNVRDALSAFSRLISNTHKQSAIPKRQKYSMSIWTPPPSRWRASWAMTESGSRALKIIFQRLSTFPRSIKARLLRIFRKIGLP